MAVWVVSGMLVTTWKHGFRCNVKTLKKRGIGEVLMLLGEICKKGLVLKSREIERVRKERYLKKTLNNSVLHLSVTVLKKGQHLWVILGFNTPFVGSLKRRK